MKNITKLTLAIIFAIVLAMNVSAITGNNSNNYTHVGIINSIQANTSSNNIDTRITGGIHPINLGNTTNIDSRFGIFDINRAPNVTNITYPINNVTITATSTLLIFTPEDKDNNTMKCYVYANRTSSPTLTLINTTSNIKNASIVQVNYSNLVSATYNWYVQCEDGALNSTLSSPGEFTIITEEEEEEEEPTPSPGSSTAPSSGGGGGGAVIPTTTFDISRSTIHEEIKQGESKTIEITITNRGYTSIPITIDYTDLKSNLLIDETSFTLKAKEEKTIKLTFFASDIEDPRIIPGRIKVSSPTITKTINTIIEVKSKFALFDILTTINHPKTLTTKDNVSFTSKIINMGDLYPVDVTLTYGIRTFENETLLSKEDTFAVYKEINITRELEIPDYMKDDDYFIFTELTYKGEKAISSDIFTIQDRLDLPFNITIIKIYMWWLLLLIILIIIIRKLYKERKKITHKEIVIAITILLSAIIIILTYLNYERLIDILSQIVNLRLLASILINLAQLSFAFTIGVASILAIYKRNKMIREGLNIVYKLRLIKTSFETIRKTLIRKQFKAKDINNILNAYFKKSEVKFWQEYKLVKIIAKKRAKGDTDKKIATYLKLDGWDMKLVKKVLKY